MEDDLYPVTDLRIIKDNTVQPFLAFMPAAHGHHIAVSAIEAEIVLSTFESVQNVTGGFHRSDQLILLCRMVMQRLRVGFVPFTHQLPPSNRPHHHRL